MLSAGEYTQGAGAMALLITANPDLITLHEEVGVATKSAGNIFDVLNNRKQISFGTYVYHHKGEIQSPMADVSGFRISQVVGEESPTQLGYRYCQFEG